MPSSRPARGGPAGGHPLPGLHVVRLTPEDWRSYAELAPSVGREIPAGR